MMDEKPALKEKPKSLTAAEALDKWVQDFILNTPNAENTTNYNIIIHHVSQIKARLA